MIGTSAPGGERLARLAARVADGSWPAAALLAGAALALLGALVLPAAVVVLPLMLAGNVALVTLLALETGAAPALRCLLLTVLLLAPLLLLGAGPLGYVLLIAWLPALLAGLALRTWGSLSLGLLPLVALALGVLLLVDVSGLAAGQAQLRASLFDSLHRLDPTLPTAELDAALDLMMTLAGGLLALMLLAAWSGGLCLGRSLQARLRRPGAFAQEFRSLRFGRVYALLVLAALAAAAAWRLGAGGLAVELALVLAFPALLQGLAVLHAHTARSARWRRLPWLVYVLLALATPQVGSLLVLLGLVDNWADFRNRPLR
ncbi:hypothetical protein [Immundisolibacter sp.]|uniref:hypothetical protein n=1 Tax=Immundisolibacter sp. TaxID=1934948 RepID=UPI002619235D|nr:hypothetical protein [Immundisolibacter sp.]MDD3650319.1 hypothetical protein [Immundisolibacter sp.]